MIIIDHIDGRFLYTVLDKNYETVLETSNRTLAVKEDIKVNPTARSEFVPRINYRRPQSVS